MTAPYPDLDGTQPCAKGDPDRFHPHPNTSSESQEPIVAECKPCPFREPCREYALHTSVLGIWGGTTEDDRIAARRKQRIVPDSLRVPGLVATDRGPKPKPREEDPPCGTVGGYWAHHRRKSTTCAACRAALAAERARQRANGKAAS